MGAVSLQGRKVPKLPWLVKGEWIQNSLFRGKQWNIKIFSHVIDITILLDLLLICWGRYILYAL